MDLVYLFIGLGIGVLMGALIMDRYHCDKEPKVPSELVELLKEATNCVEKDETVSIALVASRESDDDDGGPDLPNLLRDEIQQNWRNN